MKRPNIWRKKPRGSMDYFWLRGLEPWHAAGDTCQVIALAGALNICRANALMLLSMAGWTWRECDPVSGNILVLLGWEHVPVPPGMTLGHLKPLEMAHLDVAVDTAGSADHVMVMKGGVLQDGLAPTDIKTCCPVTCVLVPPGGPRLVQRRKKK